MKKLLIVSLVLGLAVIGAFAADSQIWDGPEIPNILGYGREGSKGLGPLFTMLQHEYFTKIFLAILVLVPAAFLTHYKIIGPKVFPHDGKKIQAFSLYNRIIHQVAAVSFIVIVPTGFVIVFGDFF
ncbi:MAG: formate dehydrogenase subunit gamma, partial [Sulfurospirillaceae bacterium]|nr:formate dehydrogenase subunit gamma [Sulfurospirillaceae bacterium]